MNARDRRHLGCIAAALSLALAGPPVLAQSSGAGGIARALGDGELALSPTYRYEHVDQAGLAPNASASLLRTRLTFTSAEVDGFTLGLELDDLRDIGADGFDSTRNGKADRPIVADPSATELNQAYLAYRTVSGIRLALGRQSLAFSSRRFLGSDNWRLNEQTFDALTIEHAFIEGLALRYAYIGNVNRVFGPDEGVPAADLRGDVHLFDAKYALNAEDELHGYAHLLDFDDAVALSSATLGLRYSGSRALGERVTLPFVAEYARQGDFGDNAVSYGVDYVVLEAGLSYGPVSVTAGLEMLEGEGRPGTAMQTPLAGLHGYNGWADRFLSIPDDGLEDLSLRLRASIGPGTLDIVAHDYAATEGGASYGEELDVGFSWPFADRYTLLVKLADYRAESHAADTTKAWLMLSAAF